MKTTIIWENGVKFTGQTPDGHQVSVDGPPEAGGNNEGMRPMELILMGVGACSAFDVMTILKKSRQEVSDCLCEVSGTRAEEIPKVFTDIHLHFKVAGKALSEKLVARAIDLSAEKYCSASIMLSKAANVTHSYELLDA
ncbi:MAG: OsmC family protein [Pseudomonadota bacterium]